VRAWKVHVLSDPLGFSARRWHCSPLNGPALGNSVRRRRLCCQAGMCVKFKEAIMKSLTTLAAVAALIIGMSIAGAQNAPTTSPNTSPNSINKSNQPSKNSGTESEIAAQGRVPANVAGQSGYCAQTTVSGPLQCIYATLAACDEANRWNSLKCVTNPNIGTTGSR
jgi:hypothetical protein